MNFPGSACTRLRQPSRVTDTDDERSQRWQKLFSVLTPTSARLVFVSYSKHNREKWVGDGYLLKHLGALEQEGLITASTNFLISILAGNG